MQREVLKYLHDVSEACRLIGQFTSGKTLDDYRSDPMLRSAVERQFEIAGEALKLALAIDPILAVHLSDTGRIIAFRNRLAHGYATVSDDVVWGIMETDLPVLRREIDGLLAD